MRYGNKKNFFCLENQQPSFQRGGGAQRAERAGAVVRGRAAAAGVQRRQAARARRQGLQGDAR